MFVAEPYAQALCQRFYQCPKGACVSPLPPNTTAVAAVLKAAGPWHAATYPSIGLSPLTHSHTEQIQSVMACHSLSNAPKDGDRHTHNKTGQRTHQWPSGRAFHPVWGPIAPHNALSIARLTPFWAVGAMFWTPSGAHGVGTETWPYFGLDGPNRDPQGTFPPVQPPRDTRDTTRRHVDRNNHELDWLWAGCVSFRIRDTPLGVLRADYPDPVPL